MGFVPTMRKVASDLLPSSQSLHREFSQNKVMKDLIIFREPYWLMTRNLENCLGSISFAFLDEDRSHLKDMTHNPPFMFGRQTHIHKFVSCPLIQQCQCCWSLDHTTSGCRQGDNAVICPICGGAHTHEQHHGRCPNATHHTDLHCTCPPTCINCRHAQKLAKGHTALSISFPLCKNYHTPCVSTRDSSDKERKAGDAMLTDSELAPKPSAPIKASALDLSTPPPNVIPPSPSL